MFQMVGVGSMFGQANHFIAFAAENVPCGKKRYRDEAMRFLGVMNTRLETTDCLAGDCLTADVGAWLWVMRAEWYDTDRSRFPDTRRWFDVIGERDVVKRGGAVPS